MLFRKRHGGVETNDGGLARDVKDRPDDLFAHLGLQIIELRGVIPGKGCAVVSVINVAGVTCVLVGALEYDCRIGLVKVMVFDLNGDGAGQRINWVPKTCRQDMAEFLTEMNHSGCSMTQRESMPM